MWVPLTPLDFYRRSRRLFAAKTAVVDADRRLTYAELGERVERLAGALRVLGLRPKECVSLFAPNSHHLLEACYGVPLAGGVAHPLRPRLDPLELAAQVNDAGSRIFAFEAGLVPVVREALGNLKAVEQIVVLGGDAKGLDFPALDYEELLRGAQPYAPDGTALDEDAPCALVYTSGGGAAPPRGVRLSHRTLALHALYGVIAMGLREEDVALCSIPFATMNGGGSPQLNVAVAATSVMARGNDPETLLPLVANERVSVWITAPIVLQRVLRSPLLPRTDCSSLSLVLVGGGSLSEALVAEAEEKLGARCAGVYGLTETSPFVSAALPRSDTPAAERRSRQATAGLPVLGVEVKVVDETGRDVADDGRALGEVLVRGNNVMSGYHRDEAGTQEALRSGFLHTGDLASVSPDGYLTIRGRKEDVIVASGHRVSAREIEAALAWHPDVRECAVIGVAHPERGQAPVALVVLREGARATERELLEHARQQLLAYKLPERIEFLPSLPRTEAGEVLRSELQMLYARS